MGVRGPKSKIEENSFVVFVMDKLMAKNGLIPSTNKRRINVCDKQTDRQSQRQKIID